MTRSVLLGVTLSAALASGCEPEPTFSFDESEDRLYVMSSIRIEPEQGTLASGLDLDGVDSTGGTACDEKLDHESLRDPGERGVDNAFAYLVPQLGSLMADQCAPGTEVVACFEGLLASRVRAGELLVLVEVRGIESYANDGEVEVVLYRGAVEGAPILNDGNLAPGQPFTLEALATSTEAAIEAGVLRAAFDSVLVDLADPELVFELPLREVRLEAAISQTHLRDGVLAGGLELAALTLPEVSCLIPPCPDPVAVLVPMADLSPRADDPTRCALLSTVLDFEAIDADY